MLLARRVCCCLELECRVGRIGAHRLSGWLGRARVVGFKGSRRNDHGREVVLLYVEPPMARPRDADAAVRPAPITGELDSDDKLDDEISF